MKKPFYYFNDGIIVKVYQIEGDVPRLITTIICSGLFSEAIFNYLIENKLGDENSRLIRL